MLRITDVAKNLLIINVIFFLAGFIFGDQYLQNLLGLHFPTSPDFMPIQIVTHFFTHGGFAHIIFNMFALVMFGAALETRWGAQRFLFFYLICALGSASLHLGYTWWELNQMESLITQFQSNPSVDVFQEIANLGNFSQHDLVKEVVYEGGKNMTPQLIGRMGSYANDIYTNLRDMPVVGASGAIYGLLLAFAMLFPNVELMIIFFPVPIKAKYLVPVIMLADLFLGFNKFSWDNIAHFAHLGGAITGFLVILYWRKTGQAV